MVRDWSKPGEGRARDGVVTSPSWAGSKSRCKHSSRALTRAKSGVAMMSNQPVVSCS